MKTQYLTHPGVSDKMSYCGTMTFSMGGTISGDYGYKIQTGEYYSCEYCGSMLNDDEMDCRNCGAPRMKKKRWLQ